MGWPALPGGELSCCQVSSEKACGETGCEDGESPQNIPSDFQQYGHNSPQQGGKERTGGGWLGGAVPPITRCLRQNWKRGCLSGTAREDVEGTQRRRDSGLAVEAGQTQGPLPTPIQLVKSAELGHLWCRKSREESPSQSSAVEVNRKC